MITNFIALESKTIEDFEKGVSDKDSFIDSLKNHEILSVNTFEIIDYILTAGDEEAPFTIFTGEGETLTDSQGEELMFEWIDFETKNGIKYSMGGPAVYKNKEDLEKAVKISLPIERGIFEKNFDFRKMVDKGVFIEDDYEYVNENKDEIIASAYSDFTKIRKLYHDSLNGGKYVILFYLYEDEI